jgi:tRNA (mo5U34)-methyltransferase
MRVEDRIAKVKWHHSFEVVSGVMTPGPYNPVGLWRRLQLPEDLSGRRVLDIGARDGFFSFACEARGAQVVAVDYINKNKTGFALASELRHSKVEFLCKNIYHLSPDRIGQFDIILLLGVIYHLPDPCLALEIVRNLTHDNGTAYVESTCVDDTIRLNSGKADTSALRDLPIAIFAGRNETSFWDFNSACLRRLLNNARFKIKREEKWGYRMLAEAVAVKDEERAKASRRSRGVVT